MMLILLTFSLYSPVFSQGNEQLGSWTMLFSQIRFHDDWSIHVDAQYRDYGVLDEAEQILLRGGLNFHLTPSAAVTAGYARVVNYANDDELFQTPIISENRTWQQLLIKNNIGKVFFEHRYRLEQRWIKSSNSDRYVDRLRYFLRVTVPLNNKELTKNTIFISAYDELFIHFLPNAFDRNRLYGAIGYQFTPTSNFQVGYLAQTVNAITRHFLQVGLFYNIDLRNKTSTK